ncbi:lantibiotic dehydratase family protein [Umezawaea endophytica]|uniref:Lantibiotic dehydratase family protein n=1 Tax=Umezawaea endophytica TaxID=1654476 RepID=A0A9X2VQ33_9PSEU|nr:lantibiotic dehydratase family protein [Umezawaea endophytica]MCS7480342.1 lantibiotic dehydratase family protein [Umezawaea endophytica]
MRPARALDVDDVDPRAKPWIERDRWRVSTIFLLRMTGFPSDLIRSAHPVESPVDGESEAAFDERVREASRRLRLLGADPRFREAVFLSNQAGFPALSGWLDGHARRSGNDRQAAITIANYLQRFCMKNDSASFFGPSTWARLADEDAPNITVEPGSDPLRRRTFLTHWAVAALADAFATRPGVLDAARPRRVPTLRIRDGRVTGVLLGGGRWSPATDPTLVSPAATALFDLVDGNTAVAALRVRFTAHGHSGFDSALRELLDREVVTHGLDVPTGISDPLRHLRDLLAGTGDHEVLTVLDGFERDRADFETADLARRQELLTTMGEAFTRFTGHPATRGAGRFYTDRSLLYEDSRKPFDTFTIGGRLREDLSELGPLWDLLWLPTERDHRLTSRAAERWFDHRFGAATSVPFLDYARAWVDDTDVLDAAFDDADDEILAYQREFLAAVLGNSGSADRVTLSPDDVRRLVDELGGVSSSGAVLNVDLMIDSPSVDAIRSGDYRLVLGELQVQRELLSHCALSVFQDDAEREAVVEYAGSGYAAAAEADELVAELVRSHDRKTNVQVHLPIPHVEVQGRSALRGHQPTLQLADLHVRRVGGRLRLHSPQLRRYLRLTTASAPVGFPERRSALRPFAFPSREFALPMPDGVRHLPRVEYGRTVVQRRAWRLRFDDWSDLFAHQAWSAGEFAAARRLARESGLPKRVYVKVDGETKVTYVDFDSVHLVWALLKTWRRRGGGALFTEMLPERQNWWLAVDEERRSCELRFGYTRQAT